MKDLNKQLWGRALDTAVPETYTTLSGEQLGKAIDEYTKLIVRECCEVAHCNFHVDGLTLGGILKEHFGVE